MAEQPKLVPARYIGHTPVRLVGRGPYFDIDGSRKKSLVLSQGDTIMMPETEIVGMTFLYDPKGNADPKLLGPGRRVLPAHQDLEERELALLGYEFHQGRSDFELVMPEEPAQPEQAAPETPASSTESAPPRMIGG